jgi:hypothetical protein
LDHYAKSVQQKLRFSNEMKSFNFSGPISPTALPPKIKALRKSTECMKGGTNSGANILVDQEKLSKMPNRNIYTQGGGYHSRDQIFKK